MPGKLICVADFLSYDEGIMLYNALKDAEILALVKSCGPPSVPYGEGQFYQLLIPEEQLTQASEITKNFKQELTLAKQFIKCPLCKSEAVLKVKTLPFWQRIYYAGTEVCKCENCNKRFSR